jgi:L-asparaginase II
MLAFAVMNGWTTSDYINQNHPVQERILECFAEMCNLSIEDISVGIDGCSVPNFAVPLYNTALAYARLCDPANLASSRATACRTITDAMTSFPEMVSGKGRFDTRLMEIGQGRIVSKGGAEGYQGIGIMPGTLSDASPGLGIAIKISDGDLRDRVRPAVSVEILHKLGILNDADLESLDNFKPKSNLENWRGVVVGHSQPNFELQIQE